MSATLTCYVGPMFSGKTRELMNVIDTYLIAGRRTLTIKPASDTRTLGTIRTRFGGMCGHMAFEVATKEEMFAILNESEHEVLILDEVQFFPLWIVPVVQEVLRARARDNYAMIIAGLDLDHVQQPFGPMPALMALADTVVKLKAVCSLCKAVPKNAIFSKKIAGNLSVQMQVGDSETYIAVCRSCLSL